MPSSYSDGKVSLHDFILNHSLILSEKKEKLKYLKSALKDFKLDNYSIAWPLVNYSRPSQSRSVKNSKYKEELMKQSVNLDYCLLPLPLVNPSRLKAAQYKEDLVKQIEEKQCRDKESKRLEREVEPNWPLPLVRTSRREIAAKYRDELLKQIEEKKRREEEQRRREKEEELAIERRIHEQRLRMIRDYEKEQLQLRLKSESLARKQEVISEMMQAKPPKKTVPKKLSSPIPRSPSYTHIRQPKSPINRKVRASLESRFGAIRDEPVTPPRPLREPRPLLIPTIREDSCEKPQNNSNSTPGPAHYDSPPPEPAHYESPKFDTPSCGSPFLKKPTQENGILARLPEIRKKMQQDHERMVQLFNQQSQQESI